MADVHDAWKWTDGDGDRELGRRLKWENVKPPVKPEIMKILLNTPNEPADFCRLFKDVAPSTVKKMISETGQPYDEEGKLKPLAKEIAGVLIKKPEVLFGYPPGQEPDPKPESDYVEVFLFDHD